MQRQHPLLEFCLEDYRGIRDAHINWSMVMQRQHPLLEFCLEDYRGIREAHINWSMVMQMQHPLLEFYLEDYRPCAGGFSAVNAIGMHLGDPINSGLTRWRMAV